MPYLGFPCNSRFGVGSLTSLDFADFAVGCWPPASIAMAAMINPPSTPLTNVRHTEPVMVRAFLRGVDLADACFAAMTGDLPLGGRPGPLRLSTPAGR